MMRLEDVLKDTPESAVFVLDNAKQPTLLLKLPEDIPFDASTPIGYGVFEFYDYKPEGAIIRTIVEVYKDLNHLQAPLIYFDTFFNPNNAADRELLERMGTIQSLRCLAWANDAHLTELGRKELRWEASHRRNMRTLLEASRRTATMWPEAKIRCMKEHPVR